MPTMHGPLLSHNNLADVMDASTARSHLGAAASSDLPSSTSPLPLTDGGSGYNASSASDLLSYLGAAASAAGTPLTLTAGGTGFDASSVSALLTHLGGAALAGATFTKYVAPAVVPLVFGTAIAVDAALGNVFTTTLNDSLGTITTPAHPVDGQTIRFRLTQGTASPCSVVWDTGYDFGDGTAPTLSTVPTYTDVVVFGYDASLTKWCCTDAVTGFTPLTP
jgi:hypothetical protein